MPCAEEGVKMRKHIICLIVLMSVFGLLQYTAFNLFPPQDMAFNGIGYDDASFMMLIKASDFDFQSPYIIGSDRIDGSLFLNPANGPIYIFVPIGLVFYSWLGIDALTLLAMFKFISAMLCLTVSYFFIRMFTSEKEGDTAFLIFTVSAGFGGLLYIFMPSSLFGFGMGTYRMLVNYHTLPFALSLLSMMMFMKKKYGFSGISLGLTTLAYPLFALVTALIVIIYAFLHEKKMNLLKLFIVSLPFTLAWILPIVMQPLFFSEYVNIGYGYDIVLMPSLILGLGVAGIFLVYEIYKKMNMGWKYAVAWIVSIALMSVSQLSQSYWAINNASLKGLLAATSQLSVIFEIPFFILLAMFVMDIFMKKKSFDKKYFFIILWFALLLFLTRLPFTRPLKFIIFIAIPVSIIATKGIMRFSVDGQTIRKILASLVIISFISIFFFYAYNYNETMRMNTKDNRLVNDLAYYRTDERNAMVFLKSQPQGVVLSSCQMGTYMPIYSGKKTLLAGINRSTNIYKYDEKLEDYYTFYSADAIEYQRLSVIEKYNIGYVFYGEIERDVSSGEFMPSRLGYLDLIFQENKTEVYRVIK
jgi:hypothetical protein